MTHKMIRRTIQVRENLNPSWIRICSASDPRFELDDSNALDLTTASRLGISSNRRCA